MTGRALHGVNLSGWLTLESWVTPELFAGSGALDEDNLVRSLGRVRYGELVRKHRESFVNRRDFIAIASRGFNAVRIPVPWYAFERGGTDQLPFVGCAEYLDHAMDWAEECCLSVILVLDVSPASADFSSDRPGAIEARDMRARSLETLRWMAMRYRDHRALHGIEVAAEPKVQVRRGLSLTDGIPLHVLRNYYREAYQAIRDTAGPDVVVVMPDGGRPSAWHKFMAQKRYSNVWYDCHLDRTSTRLDASGPSGIRRLVAAERVRLEDARRSGMPVMVGRWSASLPVADSSMTPEGRIASERIFTSEQLAAFHELPAWFFETWKTSGLLSAWDARLALATFERRMLV